MKRILLTREPYQCLKGVNLISAQGGIPFCLPMIQTVAVDAIFPKKSYDICILSSPAAVQYYLPYMNKISVGQYYSVGSATADRLKELTGIESVIPEKYYMEDLLNMLKGNLDGKSILLPGAEKRAYDFNSFFKSNHIEYDSPVTYRTCEVTYFDGYIDNFIMQNNVTDVIFMSPSSAEAFFRQTKKSNRGNMKFHAVGNTTALFLESKGIDAVVPEKATMESIIANIISKTE